MSLLLLLAVLGLPGAAVASNLSACAGYDCCADRDPCDNRCDDLPADDWCKAKDACASAINVRNAGGCHAKPHATHNGFKNTTSLTRAGAACDLAACTCDGVDLSDLKGKVFQAPTDSEGYAFKISICGEIPNAQLPSGCQQYAEHPSVVKYKANNPADCIEIGSIGPCTQGACGMTGKATASGIDVMYTYTYGCKNTFVMALTHGHGQPGQVSSNEYAYTVSWAALGGGREMRPLDVHV
jgi:hypothetical protein